MTARRAMIVGAAGQDGSYLAESLLAQGYEVCGVVRRNSVAENQDSRLGHLGPGLITEYGDLLDPGSLDGLLQEYQPQEIYNLGAQSHVQISFEVPTYTVLTNGVAVLNLLEIVRKHLPDARLYQASSSEMFGDSVDGDGFQRESTPMTPVSPYGAAKLLGFNAARIYRASYGLFVANGILFNHESPRRGSNFLTSKVVKTACEIAKGRKTGLQLGNLDSMRDWGHSRDYVNAMQLILRHEVAEDFVVSSGATLSVREFVQKVFRRLDLEFDEHVSQNPKFMRPNELPYLRGDSSKARQVLGWTPQYDIESLIDEMVDHWMGRV